MFSLFTPIGISIGMAIKQESNNLLELIFASIAAGSFVYISCSEIIVHQFQNSDHKYIKFVSFTLGIIMIYSIDLMNPKQSDCHFCTTNKMWFIQ